MAELWATVYDKDPILATVVLIIGIAVILLLFLTGYLTVDGIRIKKRKAEEKPMMCLRGRAGSCQLVALQRQVFKDAMKREKADALSDFMAIRKNFLETKADLASDPLVAHMRTILGFMGHEILYEVEKRLDENHLADLTEEAFEGEIELRAQDHIDQGTELLDANYPAGVDPDRIKLYEYNRDKVVPRLKETIKSCYRKSRQLAKDFYAGKLDEYMPVRRA
jgi:hypothetical protein